MCSSKLIVCAVYFLALPALCPLWPFTNTSLPFPKAQPLSQHPFPGSPLSSWPDAEEHFVLDCLADAIILGLYLDSHISHLHSWVLTEARQVKYHTGRDKTMEAHLELRPGLSSAPAHYQKHCWPLFHLANASLCPSASSLSALSLRFSLF